MPLTDALTKRILKKITPSQADRKKVEAIAHLIDQKVTEACKQEGVEAKVRVEGSVAKDTWLSENPDIDVFMRLPTSIPRKDLGEVGLRVGRKAAAGYQQLERFAEHPYLQIIVEGYQVDIVPAYDAKPGEWQSATDRTPYHTDYIQKHITPQLRGEVRLLKKFMQGIGVYGAEIMVGGFSGYLCELLILKYGSFDATVDAFAHYSRRVVIDLEGFFAGRERDLELLFPEPLVIVDPVDKGRNVASAVQQQKLCECIAASREFLKNPSEEFFYPPKTEPMPIASLKTSLEKRGSALIFLAVEQVEAVPDVLWGQLYRTRRSLHKLLETNDFKVLKDAVWSNEKSASVFVFELEAQVLPNAKLHLGPPLEREPECEKFLAKYANSTAVVCGPYVDDRRWIVELPRKCTDVAELLGARLADGGKNSGVPDLVAKSVCRGFQVLVGAEVSSVYEANAEFAVFLTDFLVGKPFWLKRP